MKLPSSDHLNFCRAPPTQSHPTTRRSEPAYLLRIHVEVPIEQVKQLLAASEHQSGDALELIAIDWQQHDLKVHVSLVTAMRRDHLVGGAEASRYFFAPCSLR